MSSDDTLRDAARDYRHDTEQAYRLSDTFLADAIDALIFNQDELDGYLVDRICELYIGSPQYECIIEDALEGEVRW